MAEGLLRPSAEDRFDVYSAGTEPKGIAPITVAVMNEIGIDVSEQWSKSVETFLGQQFDYVITVCDQAKERCPVFPGKGQRLHWSVEDPADAESRGVSQLAAFQAARNELQKRVDSFVREQA